jgi:hypothetical protein
MGDNLGPNGLSVVEGLQGSLLQVDVTEIVAHEADDPNAIVDFLATESLAGQDGRDVDLFAMHADAAMRPHAVMRSCGDEDIAIVERVGDLGQAVVGACGC